MKTNDAPTRQRMACGYEPPVDGANPWQHRSGAHVEATVCAGYTCKLPEVVETSRMRAHWKVGAIVAACDGPPTRQTLDAILLLDGEAAGMEVWTVTPASKGGGRAD